MIDEMGRFAFFSCVTSFWNENGWHGRLHDERIVPVVKYAESSYKGARGEASTS